MRRPDHHRGLFRREPADARRGHPQRLLGLPEHPALARQHEAAAELAEGQRGALRLRRGGQRPEVRRHLSRPRLEQRRTPRLCRPVDAPRISAKLEPRVEAIGSDHGRSGATGGLAAHGRGVRGVAARQPERWEFIRGQPRLMAPASIRRSILKRNVGFALQAALAARGCEALVDGPQILTARDLGDPGRGCDLRPARLDHAGDRRARDHRRGHLPEQRAERHRSALARLPQHPEPQALHRAQPDPAPRAGASARATSGERLRSSAAAPAGRAAVHPTRHACAATILPLDRSLLLRHCPLRRRSLIPVPLIGASWPARRKDHITASPHCPPGPMNG